MPSKVVPPLRVGLLGAGLIGQTHSLMLKQISESTEGAVRLVAVYDVSAEQAQGVARYWPGSKVAPSATALLDDRSVDAVWICTPTRFHRDLCIAAAGAGKHVFCEKPLAMNALEAAEMHAALRSANVLSQVGLVLRFSPVYTVIRELLAGPEAGRLLAATLRDDQDFPTRGVHASAWRNDPALTAGGTLIEHSVHDFDLLTWMFGPLVRLSCSVRNCTGAPGVEDVAAAKLEFAAGFCVQLTSVWHRMIGRPSNRRLEVFAEKLFVACDHDALGPIIVQRGDCGEERISEDEVLGRFATTIFAERPYLKPMQKWLAVPYALEDAAFVAALLGQCNPDPEFAAGVAVQRLVEAAYDSARRRTAVKIES